MDSIVEEKPMAGVYSQPVEQLLSYGDAHVLGEWPDYLLLGFTESDIPELIRMATDKYSGWRNLTGDIAPGFGIEEKKRSRIHEEAKTELFA